MIRHFIKFRSLLALFLLLACMLPTISCTSATTDKQLKIGHDTKTLGEAYLQQGNPTAALKEFLDAEKIIPEDPYLHNDLGLAYMGKKRFDLAEKHFLRAIALKPDYISAKNNLGAAFLRQSKWDDAITSYTDIADDLLYATPHFAQTNLGWSYLGKGELRKAKDSFSKALKLRPDFINATHGLATAYLESDQANIAEHLLKKAIKKDPAAAILHADLAKAHETTGQFDKARQSWQNVIKLAPGTPLAEEADEHLDRLN